MYDYEKECIKQGYKTIAGIDEAGRGALAGPVIAAAVILPIDCHIEGLKDSKQLTSRQRSLLVEEIQGVAISVGIGSADNHEIERINILQATLQAMRNAVKQLIHPPDYILVDGIQMPKTDMPGQAIPKGDSLSVSIAAASVVAKTTRDRLMIEFDTTYPNYGFSKHKGYPTVTHRQAIVQHGISEIHRKSFKLYAD